MSLERTATLACRKLVKDGGRYYKRADCTCEPCQARLKVWGENINVAIQENKRMKGDMRNVRMLMGRM